MPEIGNTSVFSQTDASNNTGTVPTWAEGMAPSQVNDSARALQGAITRDWNWKGPTVTAGGTANAITLTYSVAPAAYYTGQVFTFKAANTNTSTTTINVNSLGAKNLFVNNAACVGGEIISGNWYTVGYDGTQLQLLSPVASQHGALIGVQVFSTAGTATYTPTAGTNSVVAEVVGGGGGGGGAASTGASTTASAGGGGGGGYARKRITSSFSGVTVTVGAKGSGGSTSGGNGGNGGSSSFGALVSGGGGNGGTGSTAFAVPSLVGGGSPGNGSSGDINVSGQSGYFGMGVATTVSVAGFGGISIFSGGGGPSGGSSAGQNAPGYGGGGGGANNLTSQGAGRAGGNGSDGVVIVWEYN